MCVVGGTGVCIVVKLKFAQWYSQPERLSSTPFVKPDAASSHDDGLLMKLNVLVQNSKSTSSATAIWAGKGISPYFAKTAMAN